VVRRINTNTDVRVNVEREWDLGESPMTGTEYEVINTSTWGLDNEVSGDNISADGTTNITWDLEDPE